MLPFEEQKSEEAAIFSWEGSLPQWRWQQGVSLQSDKETKQQLYQQIVKVHKALGNLAGIGVSDDPVQSLREEWRQSTEEFIRASEWRGKPYVFIDQVLEAAVKLALLGNDFGTLTLRTLPEPGDLQLEIFAEGTLAKLNNQQRDPLFAFTSNLPDGNRGRTGETKLAFDLWYRKNSVGQWELDAIYPRQAPNTWSGFQINFDNLESLFRLTNF